MEKCVDHLNFTNAVCPDCGLEVSAYGNTEEYQEYCSYPDCGCDGARLCMATNEASERAGKYNVEGMYKTKGGKARTAAVVDIFSSDPTHTQEEVR